MRPRSSGVKPALSYDLLTPLYDPLLRLVLRESKIKTALVGRARPEPNQRALDLGCGTATLTLMLKRRCRDSVVVGLDGDPAILRVAARKARRADGPLPLVCGFAERLPFPDRSFNRVISCLVFHHLDQATKRRAFQEVHGSFDPAASFTSRTSDAPAHTSPVSGFCLSNCWMTLRRKNEKGHVVFGARRRCGPAAQ